MPAGELTNSDLEERLGLEPGWIFERTGIRSRPMVTSDSETSGSLATSAARAALTRAGRSSDEIDLVIVATTTPDHQMPSTASLVQTRLEAANAAAFDLNAACCGFLYALSVGSAAVDSGLARRVLVCGAEVLSRITDYRDRKTSILFGDGAGAIVIEGSPGGSRIGPFVMGSVGGKSEQLLVKDNLIHMDGREVYRAATDAMIAAVDKVLRAAEMDAGEVKLVVPHQANGRIVDALQARLDLSPRQVMSNIAARGNTSAASIPLALCDAADDGRVGDDDVVILTAFGAGFSWGAGVVRWGSPIAALDPEPSGFARV